MSRKADILEKFRTEKKVRRGVKLVSDAMKEKAKEILKSQAAPSPSKPVSEAK